jgi:prophage antirepressor-like protein
MSNIKLFDNKQVRTTWSEAEEKWYFSVQDVVEILTDTVDAKDYIKKIKKRDQELNINWGTICPLVDMTAADGRKRKIQAADLKGIFRIVQSIPSPKAEPFKRWLAQVGSERIEEIENPEIATQRTRELYKLKGYPDDWIEKRMRSIANKQAAHQGGKIAGDARKALELKTGENVVSKENFLPNKNHPKKLN